MKRVLLLGDLNSSHVIKWAVALENAGLDVAVFSLSQPSSEWLKKNNVEIFVAQQNKGIDFQTSDFFKLGYLKSVFALRKIIKDWKPDVVHAHYATSYGLVGALSGFLNYFISVWGTDVFSFPQKSILHRSLLRFNLARAKLIFSASEVMAVETRRYTKMPVVVIPFGVDTDVFYPMDPATKAARNILTIGAIKSLEPVYGIDTLIRAFAKLYMKQLPVPLKLLIVGEGMQRTKLEALAFELGLSAVEFAGRVEPVHIPEFHRRIDIFANLSLMESFGVSVLEAMACANPVVITRTGGLLEITNNECAIQVEVQSVDEVAKALEVLVLRPDLRKELGSNGRRRVEECFNWKRSVEMLLQYYKRIN